MNGGLRHKKKGRFANDELDIKYFMKEYYKGDKLPKVWDGLLNILNQKPG